MDTSISAVLVYSLLAGAILVYLPFLAVGWGRWQVGYDYQAPRTLLDKLPPFAKRATWAHQNAFESFILRSEKTPIISSAFQCAIQSRLGRSLIFDLMGR